MPVEHDLFEAWWGWKDGVGREGGVALGREGGVERHAKGHVWKVLGSWLRLGAYLVRKDGVFLSLSGSLQPACCDAPASVWSHCLWCLRVPRVLSSVWID